jgi:hypothetical protein
MEPGLHKQAAAEKLPLDNVPTKPDSCFKELDAAELDGEEPVCRSVLGQS